MSESYWRTKAICFGVRMGEAHVTLLINGIVEPHIRDRRYGNSHFEYVRVSKQAVERVGCASAPAPNCDPRRVEIGPFAERPNRICLVLRRNNPYFMVHGPSPGAAPQRGGASVF